MRHFYHQHYREYHEKTFFLDMSCVLMPFIKNLPLGARILDVGCGSGRDLLWLKQRGFHVTGFERSPGLAELAKKNAGCEIIEGDFEFYDFSQISADAVMMMGSLVHIPHEKFESVFKNIIQALKSKGDALVSLKEGTGKRTDAHGRAFYLWEDAALRKQFNKAGFDIAVSLQQTSATGTGEIWLAYVLKSRV